MDTSPAYARPKPSDGLELRAWIFMRISGVVLLVLALGHLVIMHLINSVYDIDYAFVADRYAGWGWRIYDMVLLVLAMVHGVNGLRVILDDYLHASKWRSLVLGVLYAVSGTLCVLGVGVALFFRPVVR